MLTLRESEFREFKDLSGIWKFRIDTNNEGREAAWFSTPLQETIPMAVPASYNDLVTEAAQRDHIGDVWYETTTFIPKAWADKIIRCRVGAASHRAVVWINGQDVMRHKGGFLPFETDVQEFLNLGKENRITIVVNNTLDWTTLPPGKIIPAGDKRPGYIGPKQKQDYFHDFYNYAGIHRPVTFQCLEPAHIEDVCVQTDIDETTGLLKYTVEASDPTATAKITILTADGDVVATGDGLQGTIQISDANLWAPEHPSLYTVRTDLFVGETQTDSYSLRIGIRTIQISGAQILLNGNPVYLKGFGKHEDADISGKGLNRCINIKDFALLKWIGANSFRTTHYPYSEEILDLADELGFLLIGEVPAVGMNSWTEDDPWYIDGKFDHRIQSHHKDCIREMIARDKNHPSIILWSLGNEDGTWEAGARDYWKPCIELARTLDDRPLTLVEDSYPDQSNTQDLVDVVCINRYYGWYENSGELDPAVVKECLKHELSLWHSLFKQPVIMSEFGADTIAGMHANPPTMFSEEYQCELLRLHHEVFDELDFVVGEHVWNFADFATKQGLTRIGGNRKGVFTRAREPKMAAHLLRTRWLAMQE